MLKFEYVEIFFKKLNIGNDHLKTNLTSNNNSITYLVKKGSRDYKSQILKFITQVSILCINGLGYMS